VMQVIAESGVEPEALILEITETVLLQDTEGIISKLMQLKKLGVRLAMDDFGTGYSSLSSLARLPLDTLKLAKPFVDGLGRDEKATAFAHAIVRLGQTVQLQLIAEGIERPDQLAELRTMGCDMGQGYLFGLPRDGRGTEELLRDGVPGDGHGEPGHGRIIPFPA
jgi:EAL domain-containing protein (putative c-di-GMP-specific phosphodiesterase class I)